MKFNLFYFIDFFDFFNFMKLQIKKRRRHDDFVEQAWLLHSISILGTTVSRLVLFEKKVLCCEFRPKKQKKKKQKA